MRSILFLCASISVGAVICFGWAQEKTAPGTPAKIPPKSAATGVRKAPAAKSAVPEKYAADDAAIRKAAEAYSKAYDAGDAKVLAAHFTADAEYIAEDGTMTKGRTAIEEALAAHFAKEPGCKLKFQIESIHFIAPGVAVEVGKSVVTHPADRGAVTSRYTVIHAKSDGKWLIAGVTDLPPEPLLRHGERLKELDWMIGDWTDESDESVVETSCRPIDDGNFLVRLFTVKIEGRKAMTGSQRIGWDPVTGQFRSWTFDSDGGFFQGLLHRSGDRWVLKSTGITSDGETMSATSIFTPVNKHTVLWRNVDHVVNGAQLPDSEPVKMVRKPPPPTAAADASK